MTTTDTQATTKYYKRLTTYKNITSFKATKNKIYIFLNNKIIVVDNYEDTVHKADTLTVSFKFNLVYINYHFSEPNMYSVTVKDSPKNYSYINSLEVTKHLI